jgi:hypothetical protein
MPRRKDPAAVTLGRRGGRVRSAAKTEAARANGQRGGRPGKLDPELSALAQAQRAAVRANGRNPRSRPDAEWAE